MRFSTAKQGRVFILRLEDGEIVHEVIEQFAKDQTIKAATVLVVGGADDGSSLVVGPEDGRSVPVSPMTATLTKAHEVTGTGTIFPDETGQPLLHMHMACGRNNTTTTGCIRAGVKTWYVLEVIISELIDCSATRQVEQPLGIKLLQP